METKKQNLKFNNNRFAADQVDNDKDNLIRELIDLSNTMDDMAAKIETVREGNTRLRLENRELGRYIERALAVSAVFQDASDQS